MKIYESFNEYVELFVIPGKKENPDEKRLDGWDHGGNLEILGIFQHQNKIWKVHGDTRYEPILLAYEVMRNKSVDPFIQKETTTGKGNTLVLKEEFQQLLSKPKIKYLYIYEYNKK